MKKNLLLLLAVIYSSHVLMAQCIAVQCPIPISVNNNTGICGATVTYNTPIGTSTCTLAIMDTFQYTGSQQMYVVPSGVNSLTLETWGAQGGANWINNVNYGGYAKADFTVTPGDTLYIYVGQQPNGIIGGYNGGGNGDGAGQGGGGATDIRMGGTDLLNRIIVAGGAGGAGYWSNLEVAGGVGGGTTGGNGYREPDYATNPGGEGGTQSASGNGTCVSFNNPSVSGGFGFGGSPSGCGCEGYGGGGGWYGGAGSGNCRGGGGGSGYFLPTSTNQVTQSGVRIGNGMAIVTFNGVSTPIVTQTEGLASGATFPVGITTNKFVVTDVSGNTDSCSFTVTVIDTSAPVISNIPAPISVANDSGLCGATVTWLPLTVADNCNQATFGSNYQSGNFFNLGSTNVVYTATDSSGNVDSASFVITVYDAEKPTISNIPANITQGNDSGQCGAVVTWALPNAADLCSNATLTSDYQSGDLFNEGTTTVTYVATDLAGNTDTAYFTVTITDTEKPVISSVPADINLGNDAGQCGAVVVWQAPSVTDNCTGLVTLTSDYQSGDLFSIGTTTVTYIATDLAGNTDTAYFTVTVIDTSAPVISNIPAPISVANDSGLCGATVTWLPLTVADNCNQVTFGSNYQSGNFFNLGSTNVVYTATDSSGNVDSASFVITVYDAEKPTISNIPANITQGNDSGQCGAVVTWALPNAADLCSNATLTSDYQSGDLFNEGTTTVTYVATDLAGNTDTAYFTVTITDTEKPVISSVPADINLGNDAGQCGAVVVWQAPSVTDNCTGLVTLTSDYQSGDLFSIGTTTVTYIATDLAGNTDTAYFTVTITDTEKPVITSVPADINLGNDAGQCGAIAVWQTPSATDNCTGTVTLTSDYQSGDLFNVGTTTVTYVATDSAGNSDSATFNIVVSDTEKPVFTACSANISQCAGQVLYTTPTATDNCSQVIALLASGPANGDTLAAGNYTVIYVATDSASNSDTCTFTITVNAAPTVALSLVLANNICTTDAAFTLTGGTPTGGNYSGTGVTGTSFDPAVAGAGSHNITYTYTNGTGCTDSATDVIMVSICTGINELGQATFQLFPNPNNGQFTFTCSEKGTLDIIDVSGHIVSQHQITSTRQQINTGSIASGVYLVKYTSTKTTSTARLVIQH